MNTEHTVRAIKTSRKDPDNGKVKLSRKQALS
jgi:hypothetical protein